MNDLVVKKLVKAMIATATGCCAMLLAGCAPHEEAVPPQKVIEKTTIEKAPAQKPKTVIVQQSPKPAPKTKTETNVTVDVKSAPEKTLPEPAPSPAPSAPKQSAPEPPTSESGATKASQSRTPVVKKAGAAQPKTKNSLAPPAKSSKAKSAPSHGLTVRAEVVATSKMPEPKSVPYKDALVFTKYKVLGVESGSYDKKEILVAQWGMKDKKLQPAAHQKVGDVETLSLEPLSRRSDLESVMRSDDTGEYNLEPYFAG